MFAFVRERSSTRSPSMNSGEDEPNFLKPSPFRASQGKCTGEPQTSAPFETNLFHDGFRNEAALVTLCLRSKSLPCKSENKWGKAKNNSYIHTKKAPHTQRYCVLAEDTG